MPRRAAIDRPAFLQLSLPESIRGWLDAHLWSEVEGRVPYGAHSRFIQERIYEYQTWRVLDLSPYGFPQGMFVKGPEEVIRRLASRLEQQEITT